MKRRIFILVAAIITIAVLLVWVYVLQSRRFPPNGPLEFTGDCMPASIYGLKVFCVSKSLAGWKMYDLESGIDESLADISNPPSYYDLRNIKFIGDNIVWIRDIPDSQNSEEDVPDPENYNIYVYSLNSKTVKRLDLPQSIKGELAFDGQYIAWFQKSDAISRENELYVYDFRKENVVFTDSTPSIKRYLRVKDGRVVWTDNRNHKNDKSVRSYLYSDIYSRNLETGKTDIVKKSPTSKTNLALDGNNLVWVDDGAAIFNFLYMKDLSDGSERILDSRVLGEMNYPDSSIGIYGDKVWYVKESLIEEMPSPYYPRLTHSLFVYDMSQRQYKRMFDADLIWLINDGDTLLVKDSSKWEPFVLLKL